MLPSNMLLLNLILLIDVTFSTPTPGFNSWEKLLYDFGTSSMILALVRLPIPAASKKQTRYPDKTRPCRQLYQPRPDYRPL